MKISNSKKELARIISENGGWRDAAKFYAQDGCGEIWSYERKPTYSKYSYGFTGDEIDVEIRASTIKNFHQTILSREEYFHLDPATDADGWIEWNGGECPVGDCEIVQVKYRDDDGSGLDAIEACELYWDHYGKDCDIIAYRTHKPEQANPEFCESVTRSIPEPESKPTIEQLSSDYRNRKDYADRKQEEADAAKADADEALRRLELAGEAIGLIVTPVRVEKEPEMVITDWRDLMVGDEVELTKLNGGCVDIGEIGSIVKVTDSMILVDYPSQRAHRHSIKPTQECRFKFIRRP